MSDIAKNLEELLNSRDFDVETLDSRTGKPPVDAQTGEPDPEAANVFQFDYVGSSGKNYGIVTILLGAENTLEVYSSDSMGRTMEPEDKDEWFDFLAQLKNFAVRNFRSFKNDGMNRMKYSLRGQAHVKESLFESYYGNRRVSYAGQPTDARLMIKHNRMIGENDRRYQFVESLFIETADGERFKLPFRRLSGGRAMLEHVRQGGKPYDLRGQHICEIVEELNVLTRFNRARQGKIFEGETLTLVTETEQYYKSLQHNLKNLGSTRGYQRYFESWNPASITDENLLVDDIKQMFVEQSIDNRIEQALPLLARIKKGTTMKQAEIFENWASKLMEGTWSLPDTPEKQEKLLQILADPFPVGPDAVNATEALYDIFGDDALFDSLASLAEFDPDADARDLIYDHLRQHAEDPAVQEILSAMNQDTDEPDQEPSSDADTEVDEGSIRGGVWTADPPAKGQKDVPPPSPDEGAPPTQPAPKKAPVKKAEFEPTGQEVEEGLWGDIFKLGKTGTGAASDYMKSGKKFFKSAEKSKQEPFTFKGTGGTQTPSAQPAPVTPAATKPGKIETGKGFLDKWGPAIAVGAVTVPQLYQVYGKEYVDAALQTAKDVYTAYTPDVVKSAVTAVAEPIANVAKSVGTKVADFATGAGEKAAEMTTQELDRLLRHAEQQVKPENRLKTGPAEPLSTPSVSAERTPAIATKNDTTLPSEKGYEMPRDTGKPEQLGIKEADIPMLEGRMKDLVINFVHDLESGEWAGKPLYKNAKFAIQAINDMLTATKYSKLNQDIKEHLRSYAMRQLGHWDQALDESRCNMSEAGQHCPVHGLEECYGEGVYAVDEGISRLKELAGFKEEAPETNTNSPGVTARSYQTKGPEEVEKQWMQDRAAGKPIPPQLGEPGYKGPGTIDMAPNAATTSTPAAPARAPEVTSGSGETWRSSSGAPVTAPGAATTLAPGKQEVSGKIKPAPAAPTPAAPAPTPAAPTPAAPAPTPAAPTPAAPTPAAPTPAARSVPSYAGTAGAQALQKLNPDLIKNVNQIKAGSTINLGGGKTYTIKPGDTLDRIAKQQGIGSPAAPRSTPGRTPTVQSGLAQEPADQFGNVPMLHGLDENLISRMRDLAGISKKS